LTTSKLVQPFGLSISSRQPSWKVKGGVVEGGRELISDKGFAISEAIWLPYGAGVPFFQARPQVQEAFSGQRYFLANIVSADLIG
jgi:hypothetical protein